MFDNLENPLLMCIVYAEGYLIQSDVILLFEESKISSRICFH